MYLQQKLAQYVVFVCGCTCTHITHTHYIVYVIMIIKKGISTWEWVAMGGVWGIILGITGGRKGMENSDVIIFQLMFKNKLKGKGTKDCIHIRIGLY